MTDRSKSTIQSSDSTPVWMIALYGALFCVVLYGVFVRNVSCLSMGYDGAYWLAEFKSQAARQPFAQMGVSPLEGNFDAYPSAFHEYFLPDALALLFGTASIAAPLRYAIYGIEMFLSAFALARAVGFARNVATVTAALFPLFALPTTLSNTYWLYSIYNLVPHAAQVTSCAITIIACFWAIDARYPTKAFALSLTALALVLLCFMSSATAFVLMAPCLAVYGGASIFLRKQGATLFAKLGAGAACIAIPAALGMLQYLIATAGYTAYYFLGDEFMQARARLDYASIFYQEGFLGKFLIVFGLMGAVYCALNRSGRLKVFGWTHVVTTFVFIPASFLVVEFAHNYHGVSPLYFEFAQWPIIISFNVFAAAVTCRWVWKAWQRVFGWPSWPAGRTISTHVALVAAPLLLIGWNSWALASGDTNTCRYVPFAQYRQNAITERLKNAIAVGAGKPFRGLAATFSGVDAKPSVDWFTLIEGDARRWLAIRNDMRAVDLWFDDTPTLMQYNPLITPPYYLLLTEFLSRPADRQVRNVLVLTQPNEHMLKLWGVRFLISDFDPGFGKLELKLPVPDQKELRLYELDDSNLGNYSPTEVQSVGSFREGLLAMHVPDFDGQKVLVTDYPLHGPFVPAENVKLVFQKTGFTVSASSAGQSILVLPVQYSRCWSTSGQGNPILFRANMMQLGIAFSGRLDAKLVFRFGPVFAASCRIEDIKDMERLHIREARVR